MGENKEKSTMYKVLLIMLKNIFKYVCKYRDNNTEIIICNNTENPSKGNCVLSRELGVLKQKRKGKLL